MAPGTTTGGRDRLVAKARSRTWRNYSRRRRAGSSEVSSTGIGREPPGPDPADRRAVYGRRRALASTDATSPCRGVSSAGRQTHVVGHVRSPCHDRRRALRRPQLFGRSPTPATSPAEDQAVVGFLVHI